MTAGVQVGRPNAVTLGRRSPGAGSGGSADVTPARVAEARTDLGRELATRREAAGLTQTELARRVNYSRSTVANVEIGRQGAPRFWGTADHELNAAGALVAGYEQVDALERALQTQAAWAREQHRLDLDFAHAYG